MKLKGEIIGFNAKGDNGKQEIIIELDEDADRVPIGSKVEVIGEM